MSVGDRKHFHAAIESFLNDLDGCRSASCVWNLHRDDKLGYQFLTSKMSVRSNHKSTFPALSDESKEFDSVQEPSDPATATDLSCCHVNVEYSIVYSPTYQVPVLYFNAYNDEGTVLTLDEIYKHLVSREFQNNLRNSPVGIHGSITQGEHPVTGIPCWYLHPCETQTLMQAIRVPLSTENYIKTWLSFIGPAVGCTLPHTLFKKTA